jgi:hypothetical protein
MFSSSPTGDSMLSDSNDPLPTSFIRNPQYIHLPKTLPTTIQPLPTPPYATAVPPSVMSLMKRVGPHAVYQLHRYLGLPSAPALYEKGYAPFRNSNLAFLVSNRHREFVPCDTEGWTCEFRDLAHEMEGYGANGLQELTKFACDARGLMLDTVGVLTTRFHTLSNNFLEGYVCRRGLPGCNFDHHCPWLRPRHATWTCFGSASPCVRPNL